MRTSYWTLVLSLCFAINGCGGGGGGDDTPPGVTTLDPVEYVGIETAADITGANAVAIFDDANEEIFGMFIPLLALLELGSVTAPFAVNPAAVTGCPSGGDVTDTADGDVITYAFDGCAFDDLTLDGEVVQTGDLETVDTTFEITRIDVTNEVTGATSGTIGVDIDEQSTTYDGVIRDAGNDRYMRAVNHVRTNTSATSVRWSGRIYGSEYGYVDMETIVDIDQSGEDDHRPIGGEVRFTGQNNETVTVQPLNDTSAMFTVDTDGDGNPDIIEVVDYDDIEEDPRPAIGG